MASTGAPLTWAYSKAQRSASPDSSARLLPREQVRRSYSSLPFFSVSARGSARERGRFRRLPACPGRAYQVLWLDNLRDGLGGSNCRLSAHPSSPPPSPAPGLEIHNQHRSHLTLAPPDHATCKLPQLRWRLIGASGQDRRDYRPPAAVGIAGPGLGRAARGAWPTKTMANGAPRLVAAKASPFAKPRAGLAALVARGSRWPGWLVKTGSRALQRAGKPRHPSRPADRGRAFGRPA